ncbi:uncharacterized protein LOC144158621 [Haemaphysalis longicornis]
MTAFMERILCTLNAIKLTQQAHSEFFAILMKQATDDCVDEGSLPALPFMTTADLLEYEEELESNAKAKLRMRKHMLVQGGDSTQQQTSRILRSILSWDVAKDYSWYGAKGKKKFSDLNICKLLCSSLTEHGKSTAPATLKDIEKAAMSWFRHAAERAAAQKKTSAHAAAAQD